MSRSIGIGEVWVCRQGNRRVEVIAFTIAGNVEIRSTVHGNVTAVRRDQFPRRYRIVAKSTLVKNIYPELHL